eukprot:8909722-Alexandrium_andersonii.AAC.1
MMQIQALEAEARRLRRPRRLWPPERHGPLFEADSGPAQLQVRTPAAILASSSNAGAPRFGRFDSLPGSI